VKKKASDVSHLVSSAALVSTSFPMKKEQQAARRQGEADFPLTAFGVTLAQNRGCKQGEKK
jgi:hypothetical protein